MSLLDRINQKNDDNTAQTAEAIKMHDEEKAKPNAVNQHRESRQNYGQFIANGERVRMQEEQPAPEEQELFTEMETEMAELVFGDTTAAKIVKAVQGAQDPVDGIASMAHDVVNIMHQKHRDKLQGDVLLGIGESAIEQVTEIAEAGIPDLDLTETQMAEAMSMALTQWMETNPGQVDGDMMQYMAKNAPSQMPPGMNPQQKASPIQQAGGPPNV